MVGVTWGVPLGPPLVPKSISSSSCSRFSFSVGMGTIVEDGLERETEEALSDVSFCEVCEVSDDDNIGVG